MSVVAGTGLHAALAWRRGEFHLSLGLDAAPGEVVALLGPNGSGKSTTLRCLAGLDSPDRGRIAIADRTVYSSADGVDLPPDQRSVGYVFQDYLLFPHLTARENIAFGPRSRGASRRGAHDLADSWLARLDLAEYADRKPGQLSGGQAQRVALARALVTEPDLLCLDEPLAALDAGTRSSVRSLLRTHLADLRAAVVLVTHDPIDAMVLADRVVVVEEGRVVQVDDPATIARRPASSYVAQLVGLNMLRGDAIHGLVGLDGGGRVVVSDRTIVGRVVVAIRPEAIVVHRHEPEGSSRNVWPARVRTIESHGDRVRLDLVGTPSVSAVVTPDAVAALRLSEGADVWLSLKATDLDVYPA